MRPMPAFAMSPASSSRFFHHWSTGNPTKNKNNISIVGSPTISATPGGHCIGLRNGRDIYLARNLIVKRVLRSKIRRTSPGPPYINMARATSTVCYSKRCWVYNFGKSGLGLNQKSICSTLHASIPDVTIAVHLCSHAIGRVWSRQLLRLTEGIP